MSDPQLHWTDADGHPQASVWRGNGPAPKRLRAVDDTLAADAAFPLVCEGTALVWQGDYHQARQMLQALERRIDKARARQRPVPLPAGAHPLAHAFHQQRKQQAERTRILSLLVLPFGAGHTLALRRAPDTAPAAAALGEAPVPYLLPLREWLGMVGAWQWRSQGVPVPQLGPDARLHPHHGVFAPVRGEYLDLVAQAPLPAALATYPLAVDVGTGTGVLAALLAQRGVGPIVATDTSARALACAAETFAHFSLQHITLEAAALCGSASNAGLIVCNPPWLPGKVHSSLDAAVYDPDSAMLRGFLASVRRHLAPEGEAWLIVSDLAEHLGLRSRAELLGWIEAGGLQVAGRLDTRPTHRKAQDRSDPLHAARAAEVTSLWRLKATP